MPTSDPSSSGSPTPSPAHVPLGLWAQSAYSADDIDEVEAPGIVDVLVVGAGINGALAAWRAARAGFSVRILEARPLPGQLASGLNTGKVTALQGRQLTSIARVAGAEAAADYAREQQAAVEEIRELSDDLGVPYREVNAGIAVLSSGDFDRLEAERDLLDRAGLASSLSARPVDASYAAGSLTLAEQIQLDPAQLLHAVLGEARQLGARLHVRQRVRRFGQTSEGHRLSTVDSRVFEGRHLVVATGAPLPARGAYFTRVSAHRSYQVAFRGPALQTPALLSVSDITRSIRSADEPGFNLIVGGEGHPTGRVGSERAGVARIVEWAAEAFPAHTPAAWWSAQDYTTGDHRPIVESLPSKSGTLSVVSGMNKWGLTNAVVASRKIVGAIEGHSELPGSLAGLKREVTGRSAVAFAQRNAAVGAALAVGSCRAAKNAAIGQDGLRVAGVCTHLGGALVLNDADGTLDCPLHGSRFATDGAVIEGYTTRNAPAVGSS